MRDNARLSKGRVLLEDSWLLLGMRLANCVAWSDASRRWIRDSIYRFVKLLLIRTTWPSSHACIRWRYVYNWVLTSRGPTTLAGTSCRVSQSLASSIEISNLIGTMMRNFEKLLLISFKNAVVVWCQRGGRTATDSKAFGRNRMRFRCYLMLLLLLGNWYII